MRSFLVTGGAGFIGSHIAETLVRRGDRVRVLDNLSTGYLSNLEGFRDRIEFVEGEKRDRNLEAVARIASRRAEPLPARGPDVLPARSTDPIVGHPRLADHRAGHLAEPADRGRLPAQRGSHPGLPADPLGRRGARSDQRRALLILLPGRGLHHAQGVNKATGAITRQAC